MNKPSWFIQGCMYFRVFRLYICYVILSREFRSILIGKWWNMIRILFLARVSSLCRYIYHYWSDYRISIHPSNFKNVDPICSLAFVLRRNVQVFKVSFSQQYHFVLGMCQFCFKDLNTYKVAFKQPVWEFYLIFI